MDKQPLVRDQGYGAAGYPPPYAPQPAPTPPSYGYTPQQTTVVVTQPTTVVYQRRYGTGDNYLMLSIIMSFLCFFFGGWLTLFCTIPAIFAAINAQDAEARGDTITMERSRRNALSLNIAAIITGVVFYILLIILIIVRYVAFVSVNEN